MNVNLIRRFGIPAALAATLIGGASLEGFAKPHTTHADAARSVTLGSDHVELSAGGSGQTSRPEHFHQMTWPLAEGSSGAANYASMISRLREVARTHAQAQRQRVRDANGVWRNIDVTNQAEANQNQFADIVIRTPDGRALHAIVRLSNFYVVQFYYIRNGVRTTFSLSNDVQTHGNGRSGFPEGYDALSGPRWANRSLNTVRLGYTAFTTTVDTMRNPSASTRDLARAMQTLIVGIAEAARIREIAESVHDHWRNWDQHTLTDQDVHAMRHWQDASDILRNNRGRSVTLYGRVVHNSATAALFLLTALGVRARNAAGGNNGCGGCEGEL